MKLGVVGVGNIVKEFLTLKESLPEYEFSAICGMPRHESVLAELKAAFDIGRTYTDYDCMLESDIDVVYIGLPNNLHYEYTLRALKAGKHVIVEKPFTTNERETEVLINLAREKGLYLFEAISNQYQPNYLKIKELIKDLGDIKIVQCNFSQYSGKYDRFKKGDIAPAFSTEHSGGALMDLNLYNVHYVTGIFGKPENVAYYPNMERGIDTSGVLVMNYKDFQAVCIGAKDCKAPLSNTIQGNKGYISQPWSTNVCGSFTFAINNGTVTEFDCNEYEHRMTAEFKVFADIIVRNDYAKMEEMIEHTHVVMQVLDEARRSCGIVFPADNIIE